MVPEFPLDMVVSGRRIDEAVETVLAAYPAGSEPVERDWLRREVRKSERQILEAADAQLREYQNGAVELKSFVNGTRFFRGRRGWVRILAVLASGVSVIVTLHTLFRLEWPVHYVSFAVIGIGQGAGSIALAAFTVLLVISVGAALGYWQLHVRRSASVMYEGLVKLRAELTEVIRVHAMEVARAAVSGQIDNEQSKGAHFYETDSSGLVETAASVIINSGCMLGLKRFIREHATSAIGIAGPRGCGKTTIIRQLTALDEYLGVYIQVPVYYEAADFVRVVHAEIAGHVLRRAGIQRNLLRHRQMRFVAMRRMLIGLFCFFMGAMLILIDSLLPRIRPINSGLGLVGISIGIIGFLIIFFGFMHTATNSFQLGSARDAGVGGGIDLAEQQLEMLHWKESRQTKDRHTFKIFSAVTLEAEDQIGLDQRDRSHPERVADLRDFLLRLREVEEVPPILIAIDELDKIASPEKAIEAVNGLKDLFHITDTHFLVSVSEDALDSFALRGVPVRDVFDSSFDNVVLVRPFTSADSWTLLRRRAPLFNEWAALLCHVVAGGLPRDVIRAARHSVELCNRNSGILALTDLATLLINEETSEVIEAAIRRTRSTKATNQWLMTIRRRIETCGKLSALPLDSLLDEWPSERGAVNEIVGPTALETSLGVFLLFMVTVAELFEAPRSPSDWRAFAEASRGNIELLSSIRATLAISHLDALNRLIALRESAGLTTVPVDLRNDLAAVYQPAIRWAT